MTVSWSQLSRIPESSLKASILKALDITPDPRGVSKVFHDPPLYISVSPGGDSYIVLEKLEGRLDSTCFYQTSRDVLKAVKWPKGTPVGDAMRAFLTFHDQNTLLPEFT
jgi:hypothetical protein